MVDAITVFGGAVLLGAVLNGISGYLERDAKEGFSKRKFAQTVITAIVAAAGLAAASVGTIDPASNALIAGFVGLTAGFGIDAGRNALGVKV